jgi:hypothetical protein
MNTHTHMYKHTSICTHTFRIRILQLACLFHVDLRNTNKFPQTPNTLTVAICAELSHINNCCL